MRRIRSVTFAHAGESVTPPCLWRRAQPSLLSPLRPPYRDFINPNRRQPDPDRDRLSILTTGTDALIQFQIMPNHRDSGQDLRSVSDQRRALNRLCNLSVLNQIRFTG